MLPDRIGAPGLLPEGRFQVAGGHAPQLIRLAASQFREELPQPALGLNPGRHESLPPVAGLCQARCENPGPRAGFAD